MQTTCLFANNRRYLSGRSCPRPLCVVALSLYQYFVPVTLYYSHQQGNFHVQFDRLTDLDLETNDWNEKRKPREQG